MFDEICSPYPWEFELYVKNNIPLWECKTHERKDLGTIYQDKEGSYVKAVVCPMPAQFWEFVVYCSESNKIYKISTGSGGLEIFFNTMKNIAQGIILVNSIE